MDTLIGTIERITFYNEENGYTVLKMTPDSRQNPQATARDGTVTVVGAMPEIGVGETIEFLGGWISDPRYGLQFRAEVVRPVIPTSEDGIVNYLSSGLVKGIGPRTARKIVDHFGADTLTILERNPKRLDEVPGLKTDLAKKLITAWAQNQVVRQTMIYLQGFGISSKMAVRIHNEYGGDTVARLQENPYKLADEVFGIGFLKADTIAQNMGVKADSAVRLRAGLSYALNTLAGEGHVYAPRPLLLETCARLLGVDMTQAVADALEAEIAANELHSEVVQDKEGGDVQAIYLPQFYTAETEAAELLSNLTRQPSSLTGAWKNTQWDTFLAELARQNEVDLTAQQQGAVRAALTSKLSVLTGGPGTGKTTTLRMVINALVHAKRSFKLASPTGRAAKRLAEATGYPASTLHRLLGYTPHEGFTVDEDSPLDADMLIVDESSMVDLVLFYHLLRALRPTTHLMLVGDIDQLPSVGAGNVLRDVIESGLAHVTRLNAIFRQSEDSLIIVNAHRINQGEAPYMHNNSQDFFFFKEEDPDAAADLLIDIVQNRLPRKFGINPLDDVQVIAPMYRGPAGVTALNERLQATLNGDVRLAQKKIGGRLFRVGDKVMQTKNNYDKDVFNGDIGRIRAIDLEESLLHVVIDERIIEYEFTDLDELTLAYCISTHRSQGGEYPFVVIPLLTQHYMMLQRNLVYTAITRAKQTVVLVGSPRAMHMAVSNNKVEERYSALVGRVT